jgi:hypothetical protein
MISFVLNFEHLNFEIVSDFGFRYSSLKGLALRNILNCQKRDYNFKKTY